MLNADLSPLDRCLRPPALALALGLLSFLAPAPAAADDLAWAGFRGPGGNGALDARLPAGEGPPGLELAWVRPLGSGYAGVAARADVLVTAFQAEANDVVAAFDPATGEERWRHVLGETYEGHDGSHDGPISTPLLDGERVYALGPWGRLVALRVADGEALWEVDLVEELEAPKPWYGFATSPLLAGGKLWVETGGEKGALTAFDPATGEVVHRGLEGVVFYQSPVLTELGGRAQVVYADNARVVGVDPESGRELWSWAHEGQGGMGAWTLSPIVAGDGRIFLNHDDHASALLEVRANGDGLEAAPVWSGRALSRSYSPATVWDGHAYGYVARYLSCADLESGEETWRSRQPGDGFLVVVGGQLAVLTKKGTFHLGPASPEGWSETAALKVFDDLAWTPPSYSDGSFYLRSLGELARVDVVRKKTDARGDEGPVPAIVADLRARLARGEDPRKAVDAVLEGRELPVVEGNQVVFLYRAPARDVGIAGDMIGARRDEPMRRVEGTDLWWYASELEPGAMISYVFLVDFEPTPDPSHSRRYRSTLLGPNMDTREETIEMSWMAMPGWRSAEHFREPGSGPRGRVAEHALEVALPAPEGGEAPAPVAVPLQVWLPPGYDEGEERYPVVYVLGENARNEGRWTNTLDHLAGEAFAEAIVVFVEAPPFALPYDRYLEAFGEEIVPFVDETYRTIPEARARASVGQGYAGRLAFASAFANPGLVGAVGVQSFFVIEVLFAQLMETMGDTTAAELPLRVYLDWGRWDLRSPHEGWDMRRASRRFGELLRERGWDPQGGEVLAGTDWVSWRQRTDRLLAALFPPEGVPRGDEEASR